MPAIGVNLSEVQESKPVPGGTYSLTIAEAEYVEEKHQIVVHIGIDDHLDAPNIRHYISLPNDQDDARKSAFKALMLKRFLVAFGIEHSDDEIDPDNFAGCSAELELTLTEPNDNGQIYNRIVLPFLPDEEAPKPKAGAAKKPGSKAPPKR